MELVFEFLLELILEGSIEASKSHKIPKGIRYLLIVLIVSFFAVVIGLILFTGILMLKRNIIAALFFLLIGFFMLIMSISKFRKIYLNKVNKE